MRRLIPTLLLFAPSLAACQPAGDPVEVFVQRAEACALWSESYPTEDAARRAERVEARATLKCDALLADGAKLESSTPIAAPRIRAALEPFTGPNYTGPLGRP